MKNKHNTRPQRPRQISHDTETERVVPADNMRLNRLVGAINTARLASRDPSSKNPELEKVLTHIMIAGGFLVDGE